MSIDAFAPGLHPPASALFTRQHVRPNSGEDARWVVTKCTMWPVLRLGFYEITMPVQATREWVVENERLHVTAFKKGADPMLFVEFERVVKHMSKAAETVGFFVHPSNVRGEVSGERASTFLPTPKLKAKLNQKKRMKAKVFTFHSSSGQKSYETVVYDDKTTSCNCPGWTKHAQRQCKHVLSSEVLQFIKGMP